MKLFALVLRQDSLAVGAYSLAIFVMKKQREELMKCNGQIGCCVGFVPKSNLSVEINRVSYAAQI